MNHLVFLDPQAGELERILSGIKSMIVKELDPARPADHLVRPGDTLYFLRDRDDCAVRVKATVVRVLSLADQPDEERCHTLKAMQPRLQLTEEQYNTWMMKKHILLVEFAAAQKTSAVQVAPDRIADRSDWIPFDEFDQITEKLASERERASVPK